jgi:hypothetical protein
MAETPKIQIDSDWKAEAQKEKERLAKNEQEKAQRAGPGAGEDGERGPLPPADFRALVGMLAQQAIMGLGVLADRKTGGIIIDLEGSRYAIDLLDILEQKTKGNLNDEEKKELAQILGDLRSRFVQIANMVAKQMTQPAASPGATSEVKGTPLPPGGNKPNAAAAKTAGPIITE